MKEYQNIKIETYDYSLPDERIAKYPLSKREESKLLTYKGGEISHLPFYEIQSELPKDSLLIFNNTKVIRARLEFFKATGARIEIFCLEPYQPSNYEQIFASRNAVSWHVMIGNLKKWKEEVLLKEFEYKGQKVQLKAEKEQKDAQLLVHFSWDADISFGELLELNGVLPIPPYLNRDTEKSDLDRYQTVYSKHKGSVAAPTAGLHFTDSILEDLKSQGIQEDFVTLHVGAGTFKPVKAELIRDHDMHTEHFQVSKESIMNLKKNAGRIISVGTTSVRTLESLYVIGCKILENKIASVDSILVEQWEAYELKDYSLEDSLQAILNYLDENKLDYLDASTQIMIVPGFKFKLISGIITNFHQPKSTLLLLISALVGKNWKKIYDYALENDFRFLSYGDSSILIPQN